MGEFFGTDGIRGVAGQYPLDAPAMGRVGYSLASELKKQLARAPQLVIGRDTRESGAWIEAALTAGAATAGATVRAAGVITTPGVAFLTRAHGADAGVVISASHNPYQDNGIKIFAPSGRKLDDATEQAIERDLKAPAESFPQFVDATVNFEPQLGAQYLAFLRDEIGAGLALSGWRLVVDCANGASSAYAPALFSALGAEVIAINAAPNGRNINLACGSLHPETLQQAVRESGARLGLALDGDADRLLLVDERGRLVDGDQVLFIMAEYLAARGELEGKRVVATVMSNMGLEVALRERGLTLARTSVGDKYVLEELLAGGGSIGGEQSGHIIFPKISLAGDGLLSALEVLRVLAETGRSLGELASGFTRYPQVTINVPVRHKPPFAEVAPIKEAAQQIEQELAGQGRLLLRYSGTENLARVMIEGPDEETIKRLAGELADLIKAQLN